MSTDTQHWTTNNVTMSAGEIANEGMVDPKPMAVARKDYVRVPENLRMLEETMFLLRNRVSECVIRYEAGDWVIEVG